MSKRLLALGLVVLAGFQLSACASIVKGSTASVAITTPPTSGADCTLNSPEGTWQVTSPASITLPRSKHDIQVRCTKEGYQEAAAVLPSTFEGWTLGNLIIGGVIGLGVDAATGALNDYPNAFQVPMQKLEVLETTPAATAPQTTTPPATEPAPEKDAAKPKPKP
jgi:hypothetical protein